MELRHLRYFVAVAEELHFRRAAERLHVAQPAVSEQLRKLEEELDVQLLNRTHRSVSLTEAGAVLLGEARRVLRQAEVARLAARHSRDRAASDRLRIGYMPSVLPARVPRAVQRLAAATPNLETSLEPGSCIDLLEAVRAARLDAAIVSLPAPTRGLRTMALGDQQVLAALPVGHRQALEAEIRLDHMAPDRIIVLPREANRPFYDAILAACCAAGLSPTLVVLPNAHIEQTLLTVASGAAMALVPESVSERYAPPGVRFVPLAGDPPALATAVVTLRDSARMPTLAFLRVLATQNFRETTGLRDAPVSVAA
jgi:DNA-binding transcriptional LysR family regulator